MSNSNLVPDSGQNLGRIKCIVDVGENSIEIDPYVADFFFEPIFLTGLYPDLSCTAQVIGEEGESPSLIKVDVVSKRRGQRYDALRITSEDLFSKPSTHSVVFNFDSERLKSPLQLEAEIEVRHSGAPIVARIHSGLPPSFRGSVSSDLSGVSESVRFERTMTFWDWPLENARLEVKADPNWLKNFGSVEIVYREDGGDSTDSSALSEEFQEVDFRAIKPLLLPSRGFPHSPYHTCAHISVRLGKGGSEFSVVSHLIESRASRRRSFGKIAQLDDPDAWPYFLWHSSHFKDQPRYEKFLIKKGRLWEGFEDLENRGLDSIKRVQHERYTSAVPTRARFGYKGSEFYVNWFHLDEYGWNVYFSEE